MKTGSYHRDGTAGDSILRPNSINLQHYIWIQLFGYHLHPSIPTDISQARVADVGTGTGFVVLPVDHESLQRCTNIFCHRNSIWLLDLASKLPASVRLDGLDLSLDAAPQPALLPTNVALRRWDLKEPVPEDLVGVYDVVHIRNFSFILLDEEIPRVLRDLVDLISERTLSSRIFHTARTYQPFSIFHEAVHEV